MTERKPAWAPRPVRVNAALFRRLYDEGKTDREISETTGNSCGTVQKWRLQEDLPPNRAWERKERSAEATVRKIADLATVKAGWPKIDQAAVRRMEINFGRKLWADSREAIADLGGPMPPKPLAASGASCLAAA